MFLRALRDLISRLTDENEIAYLSAKALDPLVKLGMLIISARDQKCRSGIALIAWIAASGFVPLSRYNK